MKTITIQVTGGAGSGKSAVTQLIANALSAVSIENSIEGRVAVRPSSALLTALAGIKSQGTKVRIIEKHQPTPVTGIEGIDA